MNLLSPGLKAPDFTLDSTTGEKFSPSNASGKWLVLYFYPKDNTPGCTKEACNFRDHSEEFAQNNALIFGVSVDNLDSHQKFIKKHGLPFPLLADTDKKVVEKYGVWKEKTMFGIKYWGIERTTFVIDPQGKISKVFPKVKVDNHYQEILSFIKSQK